MIKRVLVTGGCGFIGGNLVARLVDEGFEVVVLDNLSQGSLSFIEYLPVDFREGDVRDYLTVGKAVKNADAVIHLAAYGSVVESLADPQTNFAINSGGTLTTLQAAKDAGVMKFVFASTGGALVGDAQPPVNEQSLPAPKSPYGASKLACEGYCHAYAKSFGLPTVILRFANIYGRQSAHKKGAVTAFIKALLTGDPITIFGDGSASRDFLYVDDLCTGIIKSLLADLPPATVMHLATARETTVRQLAELLVKIAQKPNHAISYLEQRPGEVERNFASFERAAHLLDFMPKYSLEDGLSKTWQWFLNDSPKPLN